MGLAGLLLGVGGNQERWVLHHWVMWADWLDRWQCDVVFPASEPWLPRDLLWVLGLVIARCLMREGGQVGFPQMIHQLEPQADHHPLQICSRLFRLSSEFHCDAQFGRHVPSMALRVTGVLLR